MQSFGPSVVKLKSNATGRYLTMRRDGSLRGVVRMPSGDVTVAPLDVIIARELRSFLHLKVEIGYKYVKIRK